MLKLKNIKIQNTLATLEILRREDSISRVELAARLKCDGTTVSRIIKFLTEKNLIISEGMADSTGGRPREIIRLNADALTSAGIALDPNSITGIIVNLKGAIKVREQIFFSGEKTFAEFTSGLSLIAGRLLNTTPCGLGVAAFGTFSGEDKILENVAGFPELNKFNIPDFFRCNYSITPEITDIATARALSEMYFNDIGNKGSFILFVAGSGIGCVTAIDGKTVFSKYSHAGEFGHSVYQPEGAKCHCGRRGCLETICSIGAIESACRTVTGNKNLQFQNIVQHYQDNDRLISKIVDDAALWLGIAIANQINSIPPDEVMISGEIFKLGGRFYEIVEKTIREYVFSSFMKNLKIMKSELREEGPALGAASLVVRKAFEEPDFLFQ